LQFLNVATEIKISQPDNIVLRFSGMSKPESTSGAAGALKWISDREQAARKLVTDKEKTWLQAIIEEANPPREKDGTDFRQATHSAKQAYDDAMEIHSALLKELRLFDKSVAPEKRDASESVTRDEVEKLVKMLAIYLARNSAEAWLTKSIADIREAASNEIAHDKCAKSFRESVIESIKTAVAENHLPKYALVAAESVL
jgi:hypothetical protein